MIALLPPLLVLVAGVAYAVYRGTRGHGFTLNGRWKRAAGTLGLTFAATKKGPAMAGEANGMQVSVGTFLREHHGRQTRFTRVVIDSNGRITDKVKSRPGGMDALLRLLGRAGERRVLQLVKHVGATVSGGRIRWARPGVDWDPEDFVAVVERLLRTAELLVQDEGELPGRLKLNINDPAVPLEERVAMTHALIERFADTPEAREVASGLLGHPAPGMRLKAARVLKEQGAEVIGALVRDPSTPKDVREDAIDALIRELPPRLWEPLVLRALRSSNEAVSRPVVQRIMSVQHAPARRLLARAAEDASTAPVVLAQLARALGKLGDDTAGPVLLKLLGHADPSVQREAVIALAYKGGPAELRPLLARLSLLPEGRIRSLCRTAVREIQARHGLVGAQYEV